MNIQHLKYSLIQNFAILVLQPVWLSGNTLVLINVVTLL